MQKRGCLPKCVPFELECKPFLKMVAERDNVLSIYKQVRVLQTRNQTETKGFKYTACQTKAKEMLNSRTRYANSPRCAREIQDRPEGTNTIFVRLRQEGCRLKDSLGSILRSYN